MNGQKRENVKWRLLTEWLPLASSRIVTARRERRDTHALSVVMTHWGRGRMHSAMGRERKGPTTIQEGHHIITYRSRLNGSTNQWHMCVVDVCVHLIDANVPDVDTDEMDIYTPETVTVAHPSGWCGFPCVSGGSVTPGSNADDSHFLAVHLNGVTARSNRAISDTSDAHNHGENKTFLPSRHVMSLSVCLSVCKNGSLM